MARQGPITHLPNETLEQIFYELSSVEAANFCKTSSWLRNFCGDRKLRLNSLMNTYATWTLERRLSRLKELLVTVTEYKDLERLEALLTVDHNLVNHPILIKKGFYQHTFYPIDYAFHPLALYILLAFGARADLSPKFSDEVRRVFYHLGYHSPQQPLVKIMFDVEATLVRSLDAPRYTLTEFLAGLSHSIYFRLLLNYGQVRPQDELASRCHDVESAINVLALKLDQHPNFPVFVSPSTFVRRRVVPLIKLDEELEAQIAASDYEATLYLMRFGADITQMEVPIMMILAAKVSGALEIAKLYSLVSRVRELLSAGNPANRETFLTQDLALIANCQDLVPALWSDETFWAEKFKRDFPDEEPVTSKAENDTWRKKYYRQITTPCFVVESKQERKVLCLNFSEGRGFIAAYYAGGFHDLIRFVEVRRYGSELYSLARQYGIDEIYSKMPDILDLKSNHALPTKRYYATFGTVKSGQSMTLQFSSLSYVHGYLLLCRIAGIRPSVTEPKELIG